MIQANPSLPCLPPLPHRLCCRVLFGLLLACALPARAADLHSDAAVKAALVYNFAKFVEWPARVFADSRTPLTLCFYRENSGELPQALAAFRGKTAQGREIAVRTGVGQRELTGCQILYIPLSAERWLHETLRTAHSQSILTISDMDEFADNGGAIELIVIDNQRHFVINQEAVAQANLKMSSQLLKLARTVKAPTGRN